MTLTSEERFMAKVMPEPNSGCWLWMGSCDNGGYGTFKVDRRVMKAHRFSYLSMKGEIPRDKEIDHLCRVRCCVNPDHLEVVTRLENVRRGIVGEVTRKRQRAKTHCPQGHPYSGSNLYLYGPNKYRYCRACNADKARHRRRRNAL